MGPHFKDISIQVYSPLTGDNVSPAKTLSEGEEAEFYVYDSQSLKVTEAPKT